MRALIIADLLLSLGLAGACARAAPAPAPVTPPAARATAAPSEPPAPLPSATVQPLLAAVSQLLQAKKLPEALLAAEQALAAAGPAGDAPGEAAAQRARAVVLQGLGRREGAVTAWRAAAAAWKRVGDGPGQIEALAQAGLLLGAHPEGAQPAQAGTLTARAVAVGKAETKRPGAAGAALLAAGQASYERGRLGAAQSLWAAALVLFEKLAPGSLEVAASLTGLGLVASDRGDLPGARQYFQQALAIQEKLAPGSLGVGRSLGNLGNVARMEGDLTGARQYHRQALAIFEKLAPGSLEVAASLHNLGNVAFSQGDLTSAKQYYQRALVIRQERAPGSLAVATSLNNLGAVALHQGDLEGAMRYFQQALAIQEKLAAGSLGVAMSLNNLGAVARHEGDLTGARQYFQQALAIQEKLAPGSLDAALSLNNLGTVSRQQGDLRGARQYYQQALAIQEKLAPGSPDAAGSLLGLGNAAFFQGDLTGAKRYYQLALVIEEKLAPGSLEVASCLGGLGLVAQGQGDLTSASQYYQQALVVLEKRAPGSLGVATSLSNLGDVVYLQGDLAGARQYHQQALAIRKKLAPGSLDVAASLGNLGLVAERQRDWAAAERYDRQAWMLIQQQAGAVQSDEARQAFDVSTVLYASHLLAVQFALGRPEAAFATLEEGRARALQQLLLQRQLSPHQVPPGLWSAYQQALAARGEAEQSLSRAGEAEAHARLLLLDAQQTHAAPTLLSQRRAAESAAQQQLGATQAGYLRARDTVAQRWAAVQQSAPRLFAPPLSLAQAAQALPPGTLFVAFAVGDQQTYLFLLQRGPGGRPALRTFSLPLGEKPLREQVDRLARPLARGDEPPIAASRALFAALFPTEAQRLLGQARRLLLSPDGPLWELPFAALVTDTQGPPRYLGLEKPLTFTPSLTLFARTRGGRPAHPAGQLTALVAAPFCTAAGLQLTALPPPSGEPEGERGLLVRLDGTPRSLPGSGPEALQIARLYGAQPLLGPAATEAAIRRRIGQAAVIHLATHGYLHPLRAMDSGLLLAPPTAEQGAGSHANDGVLQAWEIAELPLAAELVVLSACETGIGENVKSEGIVGLVRALQVAGARSVVATQWAVSDASTARLMLAFHAKLRAGVAKDEALRQAMVRVAREKETASPYYWAPFFLVGDPGNGGLGAAPRAPGRRRHPAR